MSGLPLPLRPWATQLALFPEELALSLGPHVARLAAAIGSLRLRVEADGGEPQGYDGLARRGPYERLLLTEWLLASEAPDEFVRRAAFGEQAFLQRAFKQPQGSRRTVALLDAGPDQLGAPRIAHLALLIVLARRAQAAGAEFAWGVLQSPPERGPFSEVTPATLQSWLAARSVEPASGEHVARWRKALALGSAPEDGWLLGDARLARLPEATGLSRVEVAEVVVPGVRRLSVAVSRVARAPASVELELPPPDDCVRLLRDPFSIRATEPVRLSRAARILSFCFSADGTRLLFFRADRSVAAQPIPHSPRATVPRPRRFQLPPGQRLVAAGWRRNGGLLVVSRDDRVLWIHGGLKGGTSGRPWGIPYLGYEGLLPDAPPPNGQPGLVAVQVEGSHERILVRDGQGRLFLVDPHGPALLAQRVSALAELRRRPAFITTSPAEGASTGGVWLGLLEEKGPRHVPLGPGDGPAHFGYAEGLGHAEAGLIALHHRPFTWQVVLAKGNVQLTVPVGAHVVGVTHNRYVAGESALLVLGPDKRTFQLLGPSGTRLVTRASDDVVQAVASHGLYLFAWLTVKGELVVWNLQLEAVVLRAAPGEGA